MIERGLIEQHRPIAIVTDGMWRKSLSAIRSLGKAGFRVHVFGDSWLTVGFWSRFTTQRIIAPDAKENAVGFGDALLRHLRELRASAPHALRPVLLPMGEDTLRYVVDNVENLRAYADFIVPTPTALAMCMDKNATMALAARLQIPHPCTILAKSPESLLAAIARMSGEFIVKPVQSSGSRGVRYNPAFTAADIESYYKDIWARFGSGARSTCW